MLAGSSEAAASVARAASTVSLLASFHHGSRVTDWRQLAGLTTKLLDAALALQGGWSEVADTASQQLLHSSTEAVQPGALIAAADKDDTDKDDKPTTRVLLAQALVVLRAVLVGHCQVSHL